jgi:antitoxin component YwqK of YwqJK toxin-antitoxin module
MVLEGPEKWFYENGSKQYEVTRLSGRKVGIEEYFRPDGSRQWTRDYKADGTMLWTSYWPGGAKKSESLWRGAWAEGKTTCWDSNGKIVQEITFKHGRNVAAENTNPADD